MTSSYGSTRTPRHERLAGLGLIGLSLGSGCTDVLSFLKLGNLFTSAMTGNAALLALAIGRGRASDALRALCALAAFSLGVGVATIAAGRGGAGDGARRSFRRLLFLELVFLVLGASLWSAGADPLPGGLLYAVIALSAVSMGIQAVAARAVDADGISTVVFTSVLIRIVMSTTAALARRQPVPAADGRGGARIGAFVAYGCGGVLAAVLAEHFLGGAIWAPVAAVLLALASSAPIGLSSKKEVRP